MFSLHHYNRTLLPEGATLTQCPPRMHPTHLPWAMFKQQKAQAEPGDTRHGLLPCPIFTAGTAEPRLLALMGLLLEAHGFLSQTQAEYGALRTRLQEKPKAQQGST